MTIENEVKHILKPGFDASALTGWKQIDIPRQAYLNEHTRIREYGGSFVFTYKHFINGELIEIETEITADDFEKLWPECKEVIIKDRYTKQIDDEEWMIDFLRDENGNIYFVMAECEMPADREMPKSMPEEIKDHIIYVVEKGDERFTNKNLSNKTHALSMLKRIEKAQP